MIFYEAPHRLTETLTDMLEILGNRKCSISREITKKFEEVYRGNLVDIIEQTKDVKGEIVIVVEGNKNVNCVKIKGKRVPGHNSEEGVCFTQDCGRPSVTLSILGF